MHDQEQVEQLARSYTEAWCSHDAGRVAGQYAPGGTIAVNDSEPAGIALIVESLGRYDQAEYDRQLQHGPDSAG